MILKHLKFVRCAFTGHTVYIPPEICKLATENPDKDYPVVCTRCGFPAKAYFSKKRNRVRVYDDDSPAIFGDVWRD